jgi:hypothetical protein
MAEVGARDGFIHVRSIHAVEGKAPAVRGDIRMNAAIHEWNEFAAWVGIIHVWNIHAV